MLFVFGATHLAATLGHVWTAVFKLSGTVRWHVSWMAPFAAALFAVTRDRGGRRPDSFSRPKKYFDL